VSRGRPARRDYQDHRATGPSRSGRPPGPQGKPGPQGLPGPQGQEGWAPKPDNQPQQATDWVKPATSGLESGLAMMFTPVQIFTSAFDNMIKMQKTWANMIGAASTGAPGREQVLIDRITVPRGGRSPYDTRGRPSGASGTNDTCC
jgi:hypothetical protein